MEANITQQSAVLNGANLNLNLNPVKSRSFDIGIQAKPENNGFAARPLFESTEIPGINKPFSSEEKAGELVDGSALGLMLSSAPESFDEREVSESTISRYVESANNALENSAFRLHFNIHEATNKVLVTVVDINTDEVIREIPPESRLDMIARLHEYAGLLFDEKN